MVVQPPPQLPRQSVPRSGSRLRRDGVQLVGVFRERRHIGAVTWQTPERQTPPWVAERLRQFVNNMG